MSHTHDVEGQFQGQGELSASECADFLEQIVYLIDNELDAADCAVVRAHIESCSPCLEKYDLQRTVKSVVARSCSEVAPSELRDRVLLRLQQVRLEISTEITTEVRTTER